MMASLPPDPVASAGGPPHPEEYVLRSGVRSGLKREFAFALRSQAQLPASLARTRSGKSAAASAPPESKRPRKSGGDPPAKASLTPVGAAAAPIVVDCGGTPVADVVPLANGAAAETLALVDGRGESVVDAAAPQEKPIKVFVRTPSRGKADGLPKSPRWVHAVGPTIATPSVVDDGTECKLNSSSLDHGRAGHGESEVDIASAQEKSIKVFVRSPLRSKAGGLPKSPPRWVHAVGSVAIVVDDGTACKSNNSSLDNGHCVENLVVINRDDALNVGDLASKNQLGSSLRKAMEDTLQETLAASPPPTLSTDDGGSLHDTSTVVDYQDGSTMEDGLQEKPMRRLTRSLLKVPDVEKVGPAILSPVMQNGHDSPKNDGKLLEKSCRRFTRSSIKAEEDSGAGDGAGTSSESVGSEGTEGGEDSVNGSLNSTPKKKMELKMSKKIALTKLPSNVRELLSTGLLEGLLVKYFSSNGKIELQGVVKGNSILCSCATCDCSTVVSAYVFEQHAGSTKKHPADFIYLQNGNSLHDVVKACRGAPLDMLEAAIQGAIGPLPPKQCFTCQKCKVSFSTSRAGKFALLCDSCLEPKQRLRTPSPLNGIASSARLSRTSATTNPSVSSSKNLSSNKKSGLGRLTRKDLGLHKLVFMNGILPEGTEVGYYLRGKRLLEGYIKDSGIHCQCCSTVVSPSQFEAHAGRAARRKPYNNIYTSNGVSLHELSVSLSKDRKLLARENDDLCSICADGGDLLLCDLCPRAFHTECVGLLSIPEGDWHCQYCVNLHQRERSVACNDNAIAAGRVAGVDPIEQIFRRCIRIVTTPQTDDTACVLCRLHDFSKSKFDDRTVMICDQCEKEYHVGCLRDQNMADLKELPQGEWFCCTDCSRIWTALHEFLLRGTQLLPLIDADTIKKKRGNKDVNMDADVDISWRLLSGKTAAADSKLLLSRAVAIFHESFDPIIEATTGRDLIPSMVYGRTVRDQDFGGMYCAVLTVGSSVVSAGILRVLGSEVAELPLVATSREHQGQGYFQSLFFCIEGILRALNVKHFVLPAADEAESIWTKKFGFTKINSEQLEKFLKGAHTTVFQGTSMLHKSVPPIKVSSQGEQAAD